MSVADYLLDAAERHPDKPAEIAEAALVGRMDEIKGEAVTAVIAFERGLRLSEEKISGHLAERLAEDELPTEVLILEELPKGPTGKILERELRDGVGASTTSREARSSGER